jgi:hypothetical protein
LLVTDTRRIVGAPSQLPLTDQSTAMSFSRWLGGESAEALEAGRLGVDDEDLVVLTSSPETGPVALAGSRSRDGAGPLDPSRAPQRLAQARTRGNAKG